MPRKCIVFDCRSGYKANKDELDAGLGDYVKKTLCLAFRTTAI